MKKLAYILIVTFLFSCDKESANDCFQAAGTIIQQEVTVSSFEKILVNRDVELILKSGADYQVIIETGQNLINDVEAIVVNNELVLTDNNTCNYVRDYGITKVLVTAPNITEIRNSSQYTVSSNSVLNYDSLKLYSENALVEDVFAIGDFELEVNTNKVSIVSNSISSFYISGNTTDLFVGFYSGTGRFQGEDLIAQNVDVFHRGSNDMVVNPQLNLTGELRGVGDLISVNNPTTVDVEQFYTGTLIFQN